MAFNSLQIANLAADAASDKKARDIRTLQLSELTIITDYFVICSAGSTTQVKAIADNVEVKLKEQGVTPLRREGLREGRWILIDYGAVVVHVFLEEERNYYNLEKLWGDAKVVEV